MGRHKPHAYFPSPETAVGDSRGSTVTAPATVTTTATATVAVTGRCAGVVVAAAEVDVSGDERRVMDGGTFSAQLQRHRRLLLVLSELLVLLQLLALLSTLLTVHPSLRCSGDPHRAPIPAPILNCHQGWVRTGVRSPQCG